MSADAGVPPFAHDELSVDCPCGPRVLRQCDQCSDEGAEVGNETRCWLCAGTRQAPAHSYDLVTIRESVAAKGLVPAGFAIVHNREAA